MSKSMPMASGRKAIRPEKRRIELVPMEDDLSGFIVIGMDMPHISGTKDPYLPHMHDHYCCFLATAGCASFMLDFTVFEMTRPSLLICRPGQVHNVVEANRLHGWMLSFQVGMVDGNARQVFEQSLSVPALMELNVEDQDWFDGILA